MLGGLTILSVVSVILPAIIIYLLARRGKSREIIKYVFVGFIAALIDFVVEYLGTSTAAWKYNQSVYFMFGSIPIELPLLFFSAVIVARFIFINLRMIKLPVRFNAIFYVLILAAVLALAREAYLGNYHEHIFLTMSIMIGLWGISNISERNRAPALVLALIAAAADWVSETVAISYGNYSYADEFTIITPVIYGLYTLGLLALMEKLNRLDDFLDSQPVRSFLKLFGIYRERYTRKLIEAKEEIGRKIKGMRF